MADPWLAMDEGTPPAARARLLRRAWEGFVEGAGDVAAVRAPIAASWSRCQDAGVRPVGRAAAPVLADEDEAGARWAAHPLQAVRPLIEECLAPMLGAAHLAVVADARGMLLWVDGKAATRRAAEAMNFAPGTLWSESGAGTNAVGTALAADHAVQVFAAEHFHETVQTWTCAAAPVHDPDSGQIVGVIDLTSRMSTVQPHALAIAVATARAAEAQLRSAMHEADARLVDRFGARLATGAGARALVSAHGRVILANDAWRRARLDVVRGSASGRLTVLAGEAPAPSTDVEAVAHGQAFLVGPTSTVRGARSRRGGAREAPAAHIELLHPDGPRATVDGAQVRLRRRQAEILALLAAHPDGLGVERLGAAVYGDGARDGTVRVEVSRLRKMLGGRVTTDPYVLAPGCECDLRTVRELLRSGAVRDAVERYVGELLPGSEAPGVVRVRDDLHAWLRQAALESPDVETLWAWCSIPAGADDLIAWRRFLERLAPRDRRHALAVARVGRLRSRLAAPA